MKYTKKQRNEIYIEAYKRANNYKSDIFLCLVFETMGIRDPRILKEFMLLSPDNWKEDDAWEWVHPDSTITYNEKKLTALAFMIAMTE